MKPILKQIRDAIEASDASRYRIAKDVGIDHGQMSRLMSGQGSLSLEALERLCEYLNLEIIIQPRAKKSPGKKQGN